MSDDDEQGDRGHRRQAAREKAQLARRRQKRRARGGRWAIQGGVAVLVIAVAIAVVVVVRSGNGASGATPRNMAGDGITIGRGLVAERTGAAASASTPSASSTAARSDTVAIDVYADYLCPICGSFEKTDAAYIRGLVKSGAATVTYHPVAILTSQSLGTKYSVRSANAAACVATYSPDAFFDFNAALFAKQPAENTSGLSNTQLVSLVTGVDGITATAQIRKCITDETYASWVADATQRALSGPIPGARISKITSTPTVLVNGQQYKYSTPFTVEEFSNFVVTAAGNSYSDNATATATPTPAASGSPVPGVKKIGTPATR